MPCLEQWHHSPDEEFDGAIPTVQFREFQDAECAVFRTLELAASCSPSSGG
jgi:hypothetical protein